MKLLKLKNICVVHKNHVLGMPQVLWWFARFKSEKFSLQHYYNNLKKKCATNYIYC